MSKENTLKLKKEGLFLFFTIGDIEYRLGGINPLFVTSLRVNIRVRKGELRYYDNLDLYSAKNRNNFIAALKKSHKN